MQTVKIELQALKAKLPVLKAKLQSLAKPKIFCAGIIVLSILCVSLYILKEKERSLRIYTQKELNRTVTAKIIVEKKFAEATDKIAQRDEEIKLTLDRLERETNARKEAEVQLVSVSKEKMILEARVEELTVTLPKTVELAKIEIVPAHDLTGKILVFDKEHTFAVVNVGSKNNLKLGDILSVYREDKFIGKVQIERIEEKTSAAVVLTPWRNAEFKENDIVKKI